MKYHQGKLTKRKSARPILIVVAIVAVVALIAGAFGVRYWYQQQLQPVSSESSRTVVFVIESGATAAAVSEKLEQEKLIRSAQVFMWYLRNNALRDNIQAGTYELSPSSNVPEIAAAITEGKIRTDLFTILPGKRLDQIRAAFIKAGFSETAVDAALDPARYKNHPALVAKPSSATLEGYLYPDSYQRTATTTPEQIVRQSLDEMADALTPEVIDGFQKNGLGIHQGVILSSIVIKETSNPEVAKRVAGVFYNRLAQGIPLGSDPTYQYVADINGKPRDGTIDSPYNTRKYAGLTPGPIANSSKAAIQAVAFPEKTEYLFFVAGDDGIVHFSKTQAEHEALIEKYCKKLCSVY